MRMLLATTMLSSLLAFPALAQKSDDMSCADFMAMESSGQMEAPGSRGSEGAMSSEGAMKSGHATKSGGDAMKSGDMASGEGMPPTAKEVAQACAGHPDMMVRDAMGTAH